jgi:iron complex outermembrane receptor protein
MRSFTLAATSLLCAAVPPWAVAADDGGPLDPVVVSATRGAQRSFDTPAAIDALGAAEVAASGPRLQLSEPLARVPGVAALERHNWAQDTQLSIRGFGARATFGIRGLRLLVDGIPATMPDGQGQTSAIDLGAVERIEVLRGPLAQQYGNASGGVVQVFSRRGGAPATASVEAGAGSFGTYRYGLGAAGAAGPWTGAADVARIGTDGWREHSAGERRLFGANATYAAAAGTRATLGVQAFDQPLGQDPGGLTRAQLQVDPRQANPAAVLQDAGKTVTQQQAGMLVEHAFDADRTLSARAYAGQRDVFQRLSLSLAAQQPPTSSGGIVDLDRSYGGLAVSYAHAVRVAGGRLAATVGAETERMSERRRGWINDRGVQGALKRDEDDTVTGTGVFAQASFTVDAVSVLAGVRSTRVDVAVRDAFVVPGNPDDSGSVAYDATLPVVGIAWHATDRLNVYANAGRGFDTPTLAELAYGPGTSGPNLALQPATSTQVEAGVKWRVSDTQRLDAALFTARTDDEIVVASNVGGRSTFRNAGRVNRRGAELGWVVRPLTDWRWTLAATWLEARFDAAFASGGAVVPAGARLPGAPDRRVFAELAWRPDAQQGPQAGVEALHSGRVYVDDRNSDSADPWTTVALRAGWLHPVGPWRLSAGVRVDNVADARTVGAVIVNEAQQRYFEPAPGRRWFAGVTAAQRW